MPRENSLQEKISSVRRQITQALRKARGKAFTKARTQYYPNSTAAYSLRLLSLSGDVELNPGDNASRTEQTNTKTVSDLEIQSPGYSLFRLDRSGRKVCAFVNSNFKFFQLKELSYITESGFHQL